MAVKSIRWAEGQDSSKIAAEFRGKHSAPYTETGRHDLHCRVLVTDEVVVTGTFNLSRNAESNAETALCFHHKKLAGDYAKYIDGLKFKKGGS